MELSEDNKFNQMEEFEIVKKWNIYMSDLLVTKSEKNSAPIVTELSSVFYHK